MSIKIIFELFYSSIEKKALSYKAEGKGLQSTKSDRTSLGTYQKIVLIYRK